MTTNSTLLYDLRNNCLPVYLISSAVPLLLQERRDQIITRAQQHGFIQRELLIADSGLTANRLQERLENRNLFDDKIIIDLRLSKWEDPIGQVIMNYLTRPAEDIVLLISLPKLTAHHKKTKWYTRISKIGHVFLLYPVEKHELPQWIQQRLHAAHLRADLESIHLLAEWTEGNLYATQQAIEKLTLLYSSDEFIDCKKMMSVLSDNASFNVFDFSEAALSGNPERVVRILKRLRAKGSEPILILWSLCREIRQLIYLSEQLQCGISLKTLLQKEWKSKKPYIKNALERHSYHTFLYCMQQASEVDGLIKGLHSGDPWNALELLALRIATS